MSRAYVNLRVWGDFACFTRPEMKVERVSYPVMTPSAARGILEAVFWEPQIYYLIDAIHIVKRGRWFSIRRNEVEQVISFSNAKTWMKEPEKVVPIQAGGGVGTQRNMLALQDVEYVIRAEVRLTELGRDSPHGLAKYHEEFKRRASTGKCFHRPALGVREFAADFEYEENYPKHSQITRPAVAEVQSVTEDLGLMLYDVFSHHDRALGFQWDSTVEQDDVDRAGAKKTKRFSKNPVFKGVIARPRALFFHASLENGTLDCHPERVRFANAD